MVGTVGLYEPDTYMEARPTYPLEWYSKLAALTPHHNLAWDVGTGNGQAAIGVSEHYKQVIATDVNMAQLERATPHPRVRYLPTPQTMNDNELVSLIGGENSVDLITVATAVHWFDLSHFYSIVSRVLRKPGGVLAVWSYFDMAVSPEFDSLFKKFHDSLLPFWPKEVTDYVHEGYKTLSFPFESVGLGSEGNPLPLEIHKQLSLNGILKLFRSFSPVNVAKSQGLDLLSPEVVKGFENAWDGPLTSVRDVTYKAFMLAGKVRS
uniref:Methyltransferase type 11 domain-containing protein n=1 Tax=Cannabis sativa TaxID=3483 RepID=A0A803NHL8_CANSA